MYIIKQHALLTPKAAVYLEKNPHSSPEIPAQGGGDQDHWPYFSVLTHRMSKKLGVFLGGGFKDPLFSPLFEEDFQFDYSNIFQMG